MAFTCRDVTIRLRRELDDPSLLVRFDPIRERFVVCHKSRRLAGARRHPVRILDDGTADRGGSVVFREVVDDYEPIYWHETSDGAFLPLEPNVMRREVLARDNWRGRGDVAAAAFDRMRQSRARRQAQFDDDVTQIAKDTRREFARAADEMGC